MAAATQQRNLAALLFPEVFAGRDRGAHYSALTMQCGLALLIAGRAANRGSGLDIARTSSGQAHGRSGGWKACAIRG